MFYPERKGFFCVGVLSVVVFLLGTGFTVAGKTAVQPAVPTDTAPVTIIVSGQYGSSCPDVRYNWARSGNVISITGTVGEEPGVRCASVITPWSISVNVGVLPAGTYTAYVDIQGGIWGVVDSLTFTVITTIAAVPLSWTRITPPDMFGDPSVHPAPVLFAFSGDLYCQSDLGLFRLKIGSCYEWTKLYTPLSPQGARFAPVGGALFMLNGGELWRIEAGNTFDSRNWRRVTSWAGRRPLADPPLPQVVFGGKLYGFRELTSPDTFEIWRTPDVNGETMDWERVVQNGFRDPQNHDLSFITVFQGKLIAATTCTRTSMFGDPFGFGTGVEVWESATGDLGDWVQINVDGFGVETYIPAKGANVRIHQDIGSYAIYKGALYIGTMSHFGAQVWRYTGGGPRGWTDVSPSWGGPDFLTTDPTERMLRAKGLAVFGGFLYLGEGFPSGNLSRYDGNSWVKVEAGPHPFDPQNRGINSLAVAGGHLFAATIHEPNYSGPAPGHQVWADPSFTLTECLPQLAPGGPGDQREPQPPTKLTPQEPELHFDPPKFNWVLPSGRIVVKGVVTNSGAPVEVPYTIAYLLDGEPIRSEPGPLLGAGEEAEIEFSWEVSPGGHVITVVLDPENAVQELREDNNTISHEFSVPGEGAAKPGVAAEAVPLCRRGESHRLDVSWSTGQSPVALTLSVWFPDGTVQVEDVTGKDAAQVYVDFPAGGSVQLTLHCVFGSGSTTYATSVYLPPCR